MIDCCIFETAPVVFSYHWPLCNYIKYCNEANDSFMIRTENNFMKQSEKNNEKQDNKTRTRDNLKRLAKPTPVSDSWTYKLLTVGIKFDWFFKSLKKNPIKSIFLVCLSTMYLLIQYMISIYKEVHRMIVIKWWPTI